MTILDNEQKKVHDWIEKYTKEGNWDVVTGYFTVAALAYISKEINDRISNYRFVLGDIVTNDGQKERSLDLLNENITVSAALQLHLLARKAVAFLEQENVVLKTLEPNFCHAKAYIFKHQTDDESNYYIMGSSNLTEAGIGLKATSNVELNNGGRDNSGHKELTTWFEALWVKPQAHSYKTIIDEKGKSHKMDFKQYLIEEIKKIFVEYSPRTVYFKMLFELFGDDLLATAADKDLTRDLGRLENTVIYNALFEFQRKGVLSLIKMLQNYNGAILADAVGLGKTWSALAVMKFYQMKGYEVILLCPKKLEQNWHNFKENQNSKFEADKFKYFIRFHTDLQDERFEK
jgi:SNF2 family DNA or RNA helicase